MKILVFSVKLLGVMIVLFVISMPGMEIANAYLAKAGYAEYGKLATNAIALAVGIVSAMLTTISDRLAVLADKAEG